MEKMTIQDQRTLKYNNLKMVLDIIRDNERISRSEIARKMRMSATSATRIVSELEELHFVEDTGCYEDTKGAGRKATMIAARAAACYCFGISISDVEIRMRLIDFSGKLLSDRGEAQIEKNSSPEKLVEKLYEMFLVLLEKNGLQAEKIAAIGIGITGNVEPAGGTVISGDLLQWVNVPIGDMIEKRFGIPAYVDNDVNCALMGELSQKKYRNIDDMILLSYGRGVGSAILSQNKIARGSVNFAGEIGHMIVDHTDGRLCYCGRRGCLTAYISEERIIEDARKNNPDVKTIDDIISAVQAGVPWAGILMERICSYAAISINNVVCMLNPPNLMLGGDLIDNYPFLFEYILNKCNAVMYGPMKPSLKFYRSELKQDAAIIGSALIAMDKHLEKVLREHCDI